MANSGSCLFFVVYILSRYAKWVYTTVVGYILAGVSAQAYRPKVIRIGCVPWGLLILRLDRCFPPGKSKASQNLPVSATRRMGSLSFGALGALVGITKGV